MCDPASGRWCVAMLPVAETSCCQSHFTPRLAMKSWLLAMRTIFLLLLVWITVFTVFTASMWTTWNDAFENVEHSVSSESFPQAQSEIRRAAEGNKNKIVRKRDLNYLNATWGKEEAGIILKRAEMTKSCTCVNCKEDALCGKLWGGNQPYGDIEGTADVYKKAIHVVVSYCKGDLNYIAAMTEEYNIASMHVISKCGYPVEGVSPTATIEVLSNVGRCDHSYLHYINSVLDQKLQLSDIAGEDALVVFLKDNAGARNLPQLGKWNSFSNMVEVASSKAGFSCGMVPEKMYREKPKFLLSAHFDLQSLKQFKIKNYGSIAKYDSDNVKFDSKFANWGQFYEHLGSPPLERDMVQMCFGGVFATSVKQIKKRKMEIWKTAEQSLSRGDSIQEGHYMERMWGMLLASPLEQYQVDAIKEYSDYVLRPGYHKIHGGQGSLLGAITKRIVNRQRRAGNTCSESHPRLCWDKD
jgi:hypothetical protein